jgi:hypothetical protein
VQGLTARSVGDFDLPLESGILLRMEYRSASLRVFDLTTGRNLLTLSPLAATVIFELLRGWPRFPESHPSVLEILEECGRQRSEDLRHGPLPPILTHQVQHKSSASPDFTDYSAEPAAETPPASSRTLPAADPFPLEMPLPNSKTKSRKPQ